jgi:hypothetical protein
MKKQRLNQKERQRQARLARGFFLFIPLCLFFFSCRQDPIFYNISQEVKPKDPEIPGSPTKMVEAGNDLYVSIGRALYRYDGSRWSPTDRPPGTISDLAAAGSALYCIVENNTLYRVNNGQWESIPVPGGYTYLQNIYGTDSTLYICVSSPGSNANQYTVFSYTGGSPRVIKSGNGEGFRLKGAVSAGGDYIATGNGVYGASGSSTAVRGSTGYTIMGIIALPDKSTMAVSTKDGSILYGNGSSFSAASLGITFDRAMATYKTASGWLLLVGVYTKGYVELELSPNGSWPAVSSSHYPGQGTYNQNTTAHDNAQYSSSLGIQSLIDLHQSQRGDRVLFASTQQKGLWAYQYRSEGWQWNAY